MSNFIPYSPSRLDFTIFFKKKLTKYFKGKKEILDIGSGKLYFYDLLTDIQVRGTYTGIDLYPKKQKASFSTLHARIIKQDFTKYRAGKKFDIVVCLWVLEHIKEDRRVLKLVYKSLKKDGIFILAVPSVWSWFFEFGRHGYHYYNLKTLRTTLEFGGLRVLETYDSAGVLGFIFMILYNWPRFAILAVIFPFHKLAILTNLTNSSWSSFSKKIINNTIYSYHRTNLGIKIHNFIISKIIKFDNFLKIVPASYILVSKRL